MPRIARMIQPRRTPRIAEEEQPYHALCPSVPSVASPNPTDKQEAMLG